MAFALRQYQNTLEEQMYLQDLGVSFSYTDTIDAKTRKDLIEFLNTWRKEHPKNNLF